MSVTESWKSPFEIEIARVHAGLLRRENNHAAHPAQDSKYLYIDVRYHVDFLTGAGECSG
jgi:hypothetical protein